MKTLRKKTLVCVLILAFSLSCLSAMQNPAKAQPLPQAAEAQTVGGSMIECGHAWGLGIALAAAALSPCSVVCAVLAWYDLALIGAYCD